MWYRLFNWIKTNEGALIFAIITVATGWGLAGVLLVLSYLVSIPAWLAILFIATGSWFIASGLWRWQLREDARERQQVQDDQAP